MSHAGIPRRYIGTLFALACTLGCTNTGDGIEQDAEDAVAATSDLAQQAGDAVSGAVTTARIKAALTADANVSADDIDVDTDDAGREVTLTGWVVTEVEKEMAEAIAQEEAPGFSVVNNVEVRP